MHPLRVLFWVVRQAPHAWRMTTVDIAAAEAEYAVVATCDAQLETFRHVLDVLHEIESAGSEAMLEMPAVADLMATMVRARMEAVCDTLITEGPASLRFGAAA